MKRLDLRMKLTEPTVLSMTAATTGAPTTADHIPGGRLLGWMASRLYNSLSKADAFAVFHSGQVRFLDGLPLDQTGSNQPESVALPTPFCLAWDKQDGEGRNPAAAINCLADNEVPEALIRANGGHVEGRNLKSVHPDIEWGRKTAVNPTSGRAQEGQLFGYAALRSGQSFLAGIEFDDGVAEALFDKVSGVFPGTMHVGKSRAAEFGAIAVERLGEDQAPAFENLPCAEPRNGETVLWLLSDLAFAGPGGGYGLEPRGPDVGLSEGHRFRPDRSFVRTATYAPFNAALTARMPQGLVIRRGSVLVFEGGDAGTVQRPILRAGLHQEQGLGRMWVNPEPILSGGQLDYWTLESRENAASFESCEEPSYVNRLRQAIDLDPIAPLIEAEHLAAELRSIYRDARAANGPAHQGGPKPSQWNRVQTTVRTESDDQALFRTLFESDHAVCKSDRPSDWGCVYGLGSETTFSAWLKDAFFSQLEQRAVDRRALLFFLRLAANVAGEELGRRRADSENTRSEATS